MNIYDIDAIMVACKAWVQQHHRTELTISEANKIRHSLRARLRDTFKPAADQIELVKLAHAGAVDAVDARRDSAQRKEHGRIAR